MTQDNPLACLLTLRDYVSDMAIGICQISPEITKMAAKDLERIDAVLASHKPKLGAPDASRCGKQVFIDGQHAADAMSEAFAQTIADAVNAA